MFRGQFRPLTLLACMCMLSFSVVSGAAVMCQGTNEQKCKEAFSAPLSMLSGGFCVVVLVALVWMEMQAHQR